MALSVSKGGIVCTDVHDTHAYRTGWPEIVGSGETSSLQGEAAVWYQPWFILNRTSNDYAHE